MPEPYSVRFVRMVRTLSSEIYEIRAADLRVGQIDVHYAGEVIYVSAIVEPALPPDAEQTLVSQIDQEIVSSYLPSYARTDLIVTIFSGAERSHYSDVFDEETEGDFGSLFADEFGEGETRN